jgi:uncharacterized membrane protein
MFRRRTSEEVAAVVVPVEDEAVAVRAERPRRRPGRRAVASLGLAGLAWRGASDERVRAQASRLLAEAEALRGRRERLRRQRRRRRVAVGVLASAGATAGAVVASRALGDGSIEESVEVEVPISTAYNQWTQFEEFPKFMGGVQEVRQLDDAHLRWVASVAGEVREWNAVIDEQRPDERIAWHSTTGTRNTGVVTFHRVGDNRSTVLVQMGFEPKGMREKLGHALGLDRRRVRADLKRFKELIESRPGETGAWRGEVQAGERVD